MARYPVLHGLYELDRTIGCGGFAKVKLARHILTRENVAIKIMEKRGLGEDLHRVRIELEALQTLSHRHVSQLFQVIETETHFFLVVEYCSGGELFDHIVEKNRLSEREARAAFRQIVSAVAYLHCKGFVHRDLKPENVLLDKDQNMKLIDFGLCAKPSGGLANFLYTSCGSPTYAAPELVLGKKYLGPEVDVWSMGVLLYALLCGFLPFDDDKIDNLYKKILSGKYEEPSWLTVESRMLIRSMLQVDTKKRITVKKLLSHPWLMKGYSQPISIDNSCDMRARDDQCVNLLAQYKNLSPDEMWRLLSEWKYNYDTATYFLMLNRKRRGMPIGLIPPGFARIRNYRNNVGAWSGLTSGKIDGIKEESSPRTSTSGTPVKRSISDDGAPVVPDKRERTALKSVNEERTCRPDLKPKPVHTLLPAADKTPRQATVLIESPAPSPSSKRGLTKRLRSPGPEQSPASPRRAKKELRVTCPAPAPTPTRAPASTLAAISTPDPDKPEQTPGRGLLGSIERSLHRVRHILTPRRKLLAEQGDASPAPATPAAPTLLSGKGLCNVSTTSSGSPEDALQELKRALHSKGITCTQEGFTLRGKVEADRRRQMSFELEVCLVQTGSASAKPVVGIRRKRLKGDAWCYKRVCEEILALAQK